MLVAEEHGGGSVSGGGLADLALVAEEFGRLVSPGPLIPTNVVAAALSRAGGPDHIKHLAGLVGGETVAAWCPPDSLGRRGRAVRPGSGPRPGATDSSSTGPPRRSRPGARPTCCWSRPGSGEGLAQFLVPSGTPGLTVQPAESIDLVRRFATLPVRRGGGAGRGAPSAAAAGAEADVDRQLQDAVVLQCFEMVGRRRPGLRLHRGVRRGPVLLRSAAGLVPGAQAPVRRHEDVARGVPRHRGGRRPGRWTPAPRWPPSWSVWPSPTSGTTDRSSSRSASSSTAGSGSPGTTTSTCTCGGWSRTGPSSERPGTTASAVATGIGCLR